jgi:uncharacterized RDD family membrane protein YckC
MNIATIDERFKAWLLDYIAWSALSIIIIIPIWLIGNKTIITTAVLIVCILFFFKDFKGNSIGKKICNLKIVYENDINKSPNILLLFIRNIVFMIWFIDLPYLFFIGKNNQRFGDKLIKSIVIKENISNKTTN